MLNSIRSLLRQLLIFSCMISLPTSSFSHHTPTEDRQYWTWGGAINEEPFHDDTLAGICEQIKDHYVGIDYPNGGEVINATWTHRRDPDTNAITKIQYDCYIQYTNALGQIVGGDSSGGSSGFLHCDELVAGRIQSLQKVCDPDPVLICELIDGNPIAVSSGLKVQRNMDWSSSVEGRFNFAREYTSRPQLSDLTIAGFGAGWSSPLFGKVTKFNSPIRDSWTVHLGGRNSQTFDYRIVAWQGRYVPESTDHGNDFRPNVASEGGRAVFFHQDGRHYLYKYVHNRLALLDEMRWPDGYAISIEHDDLNRPVAMEDNRGQRAQFTWTDATVAGNNDTESQISAINIDTNYDSILFTSDVSIDYTYMFASISPLGLAETTALTNTNGSVAVATAVTVTGLASNTVLSDMTYTYESARPRLLTGISDGRSSATGQEFHYATFSYSGGADQDVRAINSTHSNGAMSTDVGLKVETAAGFEVTVTNSLGKDTIYSFSNLSGENRLVRVEGVGTSACLPSNSTAVHDANGRIAERTQRNGARTTFTRDSFGRIVTRTEDADGDQPRVTTYTWPTSNLRKPLTRATSELKETFMYDAGGLLTSYTQEDVLSGSPDFGKTRTTTYSYTTLASGLKVMTSLDGPGLLADGVNDLTTFEYDALGRLTKTTDPSGLVTEVLAFDVTGLPSLIKDARSFEWAMEYDLKGQLIKSIFQPNGVADTTTYTYDIIGQMISSKDALNRQWDYTYDEARRLVEIESPTGDAITLAYDAMGNVTRTAHLDMADLERFIAETQYDELGRVLQALGSNGQITGFTHDVEDNLATVTDAANLVVTKSYDALNRMTEIADRAGGTTSMIHDIDDQVTSYTDPRGIETAFTFNGFGELLSEDSGDRGIMSYTYNNRGLPTSYTDGRGVVTNYTYDDAGRILSKTHPSDSSLDQDFTYYPSDAPNTFDRGLLRRITHQAGYSDLRSQRTRGEMRQFNHRIDNIWYRTQYWPRQEWQLNQILYPSGSRLQHIYDKDGNVTRLRWRAKDPDTGAFAPWQDVVNNLDYAPLGPPTSMTYGDGGTLTASYDTSYRLTGLIDIIGTNTLRDTSYDWTNRDNLGGVTDNLDPAQDENYSYSNREFLTSADGSWGELEWLYDSVGNRTEQLSLDGGTSTADVYTYWPDTNQLDSVTYSTGVTRQFTYDGAGNVTAYNRGELNYTYTYDAANRMSSFAVNGVVQAQYEYNHLGQQVVRKLIQAGRVIHAIHDRDGNRMAEYDYDNTTGTSTLLREYIWANGQIVAVVEDEEIYFVRSDHIGRPIFATDDAGVKVWEASYLPFGGVETSTGSNSNLRFPGQWFQSETGLHQNWMRDYDPTLGRYLQADPLGLVDGASIFGYALQNPGRYVDPRGESAAWYGGVFFGAYEVGQEYQLHGLNATCWNLAGIMTGGVSGGAGGAAGGTAGLKSFNNLIVPWVKKNVHNNIKRDIGEYLSLAKNWRPWHGIPKRGQAIGKQNNVIYTSEADWTLTNRFTGVKRWIESKFGTSNLTGPQRFARDGLGSRYSIDRWTYDWFGKNFSAGTAGTGAAIAGLGNSYADWDWTWRFADDCECAVTWVLKQ